jgi:Zn-finger nucleic acid-binding protein
MKCPTDSATLVMSERSGVEIDYCPECRGVWLDRGELDKIIDRAENDFGNAVPVQPLAGSQQQQYPDPRTLAPQYGDRYGDRDRNYDNRDGYRQKKKESWLGELFG